MPARTSSHVPALRLKPVPERVNQILGKVDSPTNNRTVNDLGVLRSQRVLGNAEANAFVAEMFDVTRNEKPLALLGELATRAENHEIFPTRAAAATLNKASEWFAQGTDVPAPRFGQTASRRLNSEVAVALGLAGEVAPVVDEILRGTDSRANNVNASDVEGVFERVHLDLDEANKVIDGIFTTANATPALTRDAFTELSNRIDAGTVSVTPEAAQALHQISTWLFGSAAGTTVPRFGLAQP